MDIEPLVDRFEAGEIGGEEFGHGQHVQVAWGLSRRYGYDEGLRRLTAGIRGITQRAGRPDAYHETLTRAWYELICLASDLDEHAELFDKSLLRRYYSVERLEAGRKAWLEPDLHPLRLPPPGARDRFGSPPAEARLSLLAKRDEPL